MVGNTLVKAQPDASVITYMAGGQEVKIKQSELLGLVMGGGSLTDAEQMFFLKTCQYRGLNPFLKEVFCIKYGNQPAQTVVAKDTFIRRARHSKDFDGYDNGVIIQMQDGTIKEREGEFCAPGENLVGGWARVYIKGLSHSYYRAVGWSEYCGKTKDGKLNSMWSGKPATMIAKVALSQALREAFPDDLSGLYTPEEINTIQEVLPDPIIVPAEEHPEPQEPPKQRKAPAPKPQPERVEAEVVVDPDDEAAVAASLFG